MSSIADASERSLHRLESPSAASTMLFGYQVCSSSGSLLHSPRAACCSIGGYLAPPGMAPSEALSFDRSAPLVAKRVYLTTPLGYGMIVPLLCCSQPLDHTSAVQHQGSTTRCLRALAGRGERTQ